MHVPLPHVFPPSAIRQSPSGRELDAIDFVAIAIPSLRSLHRAHIKRRRLIMPLVALVQKKQSAPATAYKFWCLALASVVAAHRVPSSLIVSACFSPSLMEAFLRRVEDATPYIAVRIIHNCEHSEQYHLPWANITGEANITAEGNITLRSKI